MCNIELGYVVAAAIAAIATVIGVCKVNSQKSFELLTKERLEQLKTIRAVIKELRLLTSITRIKEMLDSKTAIDTYKLMLEKAQNSLSEILTVTEKQESCVFKELESLQELALVFYQKADTDAKTKLCRQRKIFFMLMEIYDWSLWKYIQQLYRETNRLSHRYDLLFAEIFYRTREIYSISHPFFVEYKSCEELTNLSKKELKKIESKVKKEFTGNEK